MKHGTRATYVTHRCRCDRCREANTIYLRAARRRRQSACVPARVHGTCNGYENYRCRCQPCTAAKAERQRCYRKRAA